MDRNNWSPAAPGGEASVDQVGTQLYTDLRQRVVNRIMEALMRRLPSAVPEGLQQLKNIAVQCEEKIYAAGSSSQTDYMQRVSLNLLTLENMSPNTIQTTGPVNLASNIDMLSYTGASHSLPSQLQNQPHAHQQLVSQYVENNVAPGGVQISTGLASLDPVAQSGQVNAGDWQEEAYQKLLQMKEKYFTELTELYQKADAKMQKLLHSSHLETDMLLKLEKFKQMADHIFRVLLMPKSSISPEFKENLVIYEKQIPQLLSAVRYRKPMQQALAQPKEPQPSRSEPTLDCPICLGPLVKATTTTCGHVFCEKCINTALAKQSRCPTCRSPVVAGDLIRLYIDINQF